MHDLVVACAEAPNKVRTNSSAVPDRSAVIRVRMMAILLADGAVEVSKRLRRLQSKRLKSASLVARISAATLRQGM